MRLFFLLIFVCSINALWSQNADSSTRNIVEICSYDSNIIQNDIGLKRFFLSLDSLRKKQKSKINILHIGDSHIQGDYMSRTIRYRLQHEFGEGGRGLVFPYSFLNMYGPVDYKCNTNVQWENSRIFPKEKKFPVGLVGYTVATNNPNMYSMIDLTGPPKNSWGSLDNFNDFPNNLFDRVKIIYSNDSQAMPLIVSPLSSNQSNSEVYKLPQYKKDDSAGYQIQTIDFKNLYDKIEFKADSSNKLYKPVQLNGVIFENSRQEGIVYHMAGVGACQLDNFLRSKYFLLQTISLKPDLIIFSLGANESVSPGFDTLTYQEKYIDLIKRLKQEMPGVSIILTTPPDLLYKKKLPYMKKPIRRAIIRISEETNSAVWDLGELMGGDYSNHIWHLSKYAGPDRIHFSPKGYDFQGLLFTEALMKAYNNYSFLPIQNSNVTNDLKPYRKSLNDHYVQVLHKSNKPIIENNHVENHTASNALAVKPKRKIHVVSHNETIYSISRKYHLDFKLILRLNGLKESSIIRPGQKIKLR